MNSTWNQMTTPLSSGFAMPSSAFAQECGHAASASKGRIATSAARTTVITAATTAAVTAGSIGAGAVTVDVVGDRDIARTLGYAESFPGTPVWRPPTS